MSDGEEDSPGKLNQFGDLLLEHNGAKLDYEGRTAKKPHRGVSFMVIPTQNKLNSKVKGVKMEDPL